jgi:hypothetical protein
MHAHRSSLGRPRCVRGPRPAVLLAVVLAALLVPRLTAAQTETAESPAQPAVPSPTAPLPLSERLRAQGHVVETAEAAYLDADERITEGFVRRLAVVLAFADAPQRVDDWRATATVLLRQMVDLDPLEAPVIPPASLQAVHRQAVAYRQHLRAAATAWLAGIEAGAPDWLQWGAEEYGAAEAARADWYRALWDRYVGQPPLAP